MEIYAPMSKIARVQFPELEISYGSIISHLLYLSVSFFSIAASLWYYYDNTSQHCRCGCELSCINDSRVEIREGHCATSANIEDYYYIGLCHLRHTVNNTNRMLLHIPLFGYMQYEFKVQSHTPFQDGYIP